jgi:hypothetical protein
VTTLSDVASRYDGLRAYLTGLPAEQFSVELQFSQIEELIGSSLPAEAADFEWWDIGQGGSQSPFGNALAQAGFGVMFLAGLSSPTGFVGLGRGLHRWPGVFVTSEEFSKLQFADRLRQIAYGYLESGKVLCHALGESPNCLSWPRGMVVCLCCRHATELFYKSCILYRGRIEDCNHDISKLKQQFRRLYPEPEFDIRTQYDVALVEREDQVLRYFADRTGQVPEGTFGFSPASWLATLECLELTMDRTYARIAR